MSLYIHHVGANVETMASLDHSFRMQSEDLTAKSVEKH